MWLLVSAWAIAVSADSDGDALAPSFEALVKSFRSAAENGDVAACLAHEEELLQRYPDVPPTHAVLAKGFMSLRFEHSARAIAHLSRFRRKHPDWVDTPLLLNHAYLLREAGRVSEADAALEVAVELPVEAGMGSRAADRTQARQSLASALVARAAAGSGGSADDTLVRAAALLEEAFSDAEGGSPGALSANPELALTVFQLEGAMEAIQAPNEQEGGHEELQARVQRLVRRCTGWLEARHRRVAAGPSALAGAPLGVERLVLASGGTSRAQEELQEALARHVRVRRPVVLAGAVSSDGEHGALPGAVGWPGLGLLGDLDHLNRSAGDAVVYVSCVPALENLSKTPFGLAEQRRAAAPNATGSTQCREEGEEEADVSRLHHDTFENLIMVLRGVKRYALFPPQAALDLYTVGEIARLQAPSGVIQYVNDDPLRGANEHGVHFSLVPDAWAPSAGEHARFPRWRRARKQLVEVELHQGEMLYMPRGWFHQVSSRGTPHVAVNLWWN